MNAYIKIILLGVLLFNLTSLYSANNTNAKHSEKRNISSPTTIIQVGEDIQAALNSSLNYSVSLMPGTSTENIYTIYETLVVPANKELTIPCGAVLKYAGNTTAMMLNHYSTLKGDGKLENSNARWDTITQKTAIKIIGSFVTVDFGIIWGFEKGIDMSGNYFMNYNNIKIRYFRDVLAGIIIKPTGIYTASYNYFHLGQTSQHRSFPGEAYPNTLIMKRFGIGIDMFGENIGNYFFGHIEGYPVGIRLSGAYNNIQSLRLEDCDVRIELVGNQTRKNNLFGDYGEIVDTIFAPTHYQNKTIYAVKNNTGKSISEVLNVFGWGNTTYLHNLYTQAQDAFSDYRLKDSIETINSSFAVNALLSLRGTSYNYITADSAPTPNLKYGFIAQEVKLALPELVSQNPLDSMYAINYNGVLPILVEVFKEQAQQNNRIKNDIELLKEQNKQLEKILKKNPKKSQSNNESKSIIQSEINLDNNVLNAYPNPTSGLISITSEQQISSYKIIDMNGKILRKNKNINENIVTIDISDLENGFYIISVYANNQYHTIKILLDK